MGLVFIAPFVNLHPIFMGSEWVQSTVNRHDSQGCFLVKPILAV